MEVRAGEVEVEEVEVVEEIEAKTMEDDRRANISQLQPKLPFAGKLQNPQLSLKINLKTKRST